MAFIKLYIHFGTSLAIRFSGRLCAVACLPCGLCFLAHEQQDRIQMLLVFHANRISSSRRLHGPFEMNTRTNNRILQRQTIACPAKGKREKEKNDKEKSHSRNWKLSELSR